MKNKRGGTVKYANDLSNSTFVDQVGFCMQNINEKYGAIIGKKMSSECWTWVGIHVLLEVTQFVAAESEITI